MKISIDPSLIYRYYPDDNSLLYIGSFIDKGERVFGFLPICIAIKGRVVFGIGFYKVKNTFRLLCGFFVIEIEK